jgi:hypothetical protein
MLEHLGAANEVENPVLERQALQIRKHQPVSSWLPDGTRKVNAHHIQSIAELFRQPQIEKPDLQARLCVARNRSQGSLYSTRLAG